MIFRFTILFLLFFCFSSNAQKEDRNWVFGYNCGIDFSDSISPQTFKPKSFCIEIAASISDSLGNLILYLSHNSQSRNLEIRNYKGDIIEGGESINSNSTFARGLTILPIEDSIYYIVHVGFTNSNCPLVWCTGLFYTVVDMSANNSHGKVISKDNLIIPNEINEGIASIKHSNGKDWWVLAHQRPMPHCTKKYYKVLLRNNGIENVYEQDIGSSICRINFPADYVAGDISVSRSGEKIAYVRFLQNFVDVLRFNRCTGNLYNHQLVDNNFNHDLYTSCFSRDENVLYVSYGALSGSSTAESGLLQYNLTNMSRYKVWKNDTVNTINYFTGQLQLAPNNKIYMPYARNSSSTNADQYNQNLSVINQPDSLGKACDFQPFSFYLGDSSYTSAGLPNMPNYNLGQLSIYKADAGINRTICLNQQEKGSYLGDSAIARVEYQWSPTIGMDSPNIAMPYVIPDSSRWYYVTISDTSIQNACQSRTDSVWIEFQSNLNASFNYTINDSLVNFESLSEELLVDHTWHFGNGTIGQGSTTENIYPYSEDSITAMHIVSSRCDADTAYATFLIKAPEIPLDTNDIVDTLVVVNYAADRLRVYPNPTNSLLHFESPFIEQIEVFNLTGKQIISSSQAHHVNVQNFPSGIYIYQVQMNNGTFVRGKFVKQ